jgi:hypothetical protein
MCRVKRVWSGLLARQLDTSVSETNGVNDFHLFLIMPAILYRSDPEPNELIRVTTLQVHCLLNARAEAFLSGDAGRLIKEMIDDVQQVRASRATRNADSAAPDSLDPVHLRRMVVQGRYKEVTASFITS